MSDRILVIVLALLLAAAPAQAGFLDLFSRTPQRPGTPEPPSPLEGFSGQGTLALARPESASEGYVPGGLICSFQPALLDPIAQNIDDRVFWDFQEVSCKIDLSKLARFDRVAWGTASTFDYPFLNQCAANHCDFIWHDGASSIFFTGSFLREGDKKP
jgi:hypothetical protein